jgi:2-oxoglutarate ferredoxin oxidoreductase subunit alpha
VGDNPKRDVVGARQAGFGMVIIMMEPAELPDMQPVKRRDPVWAVSGAIGRERRVLSSIYLNPDEEEILNLRLLDRWARIEANEIRYQEYFIDNADYVVVAFGTAGRIALSAVRAARAEGIPVGLLRPISLSPFPDERISQLAGQAKAMLVVEMNSGQMLEDVLKAAQGQLPVEFYGRLGGVVPFPDEVLNEIRRLVHEPLTQNVNPRLSWLKRLELARN